MTPNEKAAQLVVDNQLKVRSLDYKEAVACAIVTVEEIMEELFTTDLNSRYIYWKKVKQILKKLQPMEKKQTAVEWLVEQIKSDQNQKALSASEWMKVIEQAKEMEKQQIADAQSYAISNADMTNNRGYFDCDKYYNETYKKENEG